MKFKRLTFNQFKSICLEDLSNYVKFINKDNETPKSEIDQILKELKVDFTLITTYDEIRNIYGYYGLEEMDILKSLVKLDY